jgi:hypothetical protein
VRVHGAELSAQAEHEAEKLNDAPVSASLQGSIKVAIELSSDIGGAIDDLRVSPHDREQAHQDETKLRHWAAEARTLAETMKKLFQITLGIIAAIGGFVGELVFNTQAGADFRFQLLWAVPVGVLGIVVFAEMTGRVAAVSGRPVFDVVRDANGPERWPRDLAASLLINLITLAAEIGGTAIVLQLRFDLNVSTLILLSVVGLVLIVYFVPFGGIESIFGYLGCALLVYVAAAVHGHAPHRRRDPCTL